MGRETTFQGMGLRLLLLALVAAAAGTAILSLAPRSDAALPVCPRVDDVDPCDPGGGGGEEPGFVDVAVTTSPAGTSGDPAWDDQDLTYNVTVSNTDGVTDASGVTLTSELVTGQANHVSSNPSQGSCTGTGTVTCNLGTIAAGGSATVTIAVRPSAGTLKHRFTTDSADLNGDLVDKTTTVRASAPSAAIDWSMPQRATDTNVDGLIDPLPPGGDFTPDNWSVTLNACGSNGGHQAITSYKWELRGLPEVVTANCSHGIQVPAEKIYPAKLTITLADGQTRTAERDIKVADRLIAVMGDSFGSGEGNPHTPIVYDDDSVVAPPTWLDTRCHRSMHAASAQAARTLEVEDPRSSVTYVSRACSGATIAEGVLGPYNGIETTNPVNDQKTGYLPPQIQQIDQVLGEGAKIDDLVISIGGNDVGFAKVLSDCMFPGDCFSNTSLINEINTSFAGLKEQHYPEMRDTIKTTLEAKSTYITEYPDFTTDANGNRCAAMGADIQWPLSISAAESEWAQNFVGAGLVAALTEQVQLANAAPHNLDWHYVGGVAAAWTQLGQFGHGYCVGDPGVRDPNRWVRTFKDSCDLQGPPGYFLFGVHFCNNGADGPMKTAGLFHPNEHGHAAIAGRYLPVMRDNPPAVAAADAPPGGGGGDGGGGDGGDGGGGDTGGGDTGGGDTGGGGTGGGNSPVLTPLPNGAPTFGGNLPKPVARRPGKCSKLKGKKRARCVKKACGRFNRGRRSAAKKRKYANCVRSVMRKR